MESTCTAVYISPNKCSYAEGKCLFKSFSGWGTDRNIRRCNGQNSAETLCCGFLVLESQCCGILVLESRCCGFSVLESWCHGTLSFCRILTPMMMMNCFCDMVDWRKAFSLISSQDHCQRSSPSRISDTDNH